MDPLKKEAEILRLLRIFGDMREIAHILPGMLAQKGFSVSSEELGKIITTLIRQEKLDLRFHQRTGEFILEDHSPA